MSSRDVKIFVYPKDFILPLFTFLPQTHKVIPLRGVKAHDELVKSLGSGIVSSVT